MSGSAASAARRSPRRLRPRQPPPAPAETAATERRLVSVLFADLVGFTTLSESRDPEEVRELLSRYFDTCSRLVGLYGGVVEKFIGDAVMAVWGTPVATEDDAERAVRTGARPGRSGAGARPGGRRRGLRARAGVMTGEAAVNLAAVGRGHGRGRPRQHRVPRAVGGGVGLGLRRRGHATGDRGSNRLREGRQLRAEGQGGRDAAVACVARHIRTRRLAQVGRPGGAVRGPRPRAAPDQGPVPRGR